MKEVGTVIQIPITRFVLSSCNDYSFGGCDAPLSSRDMQIAGRLAARLGFRDWRAESYSISNGRTRRGSCVMSSERIVLRITMSTAPDHSI